MQRYQTEDERRKAMRAKINKTIKRGRRRKRIIRRLDKAVPGICIGVLIAGMGAWCIAAPLPDPDDYEPYRFQAENGQWYTQEEYEQMSRERDAYYSKNFNYATYEQSLSRIHRIGQRNTCTYIDLETEGTVDEMIGKALARKEDMAKTVVDDWRAYFE